MKKISVIVPVYNVEKYIDECLKSLENQTIFKDLEVVIINDGSTDNSQEIVDKYEKKYPNIFKYYKKENGGLSSARNYALKHITGEYVTFLDSDDYVVPDAYEKMYNKAKNDELDIVMCELLWFYPDGRLEYRKMIPDFVKNERVETKYLLSNPAACNKIYKRELWNNIEFPINIWYEDLATTPLLIKQTKKIGFLHEELYMYRQRDNSIMSNNKYSKRLLEILDSCGNLYKNLYNSEYLQELEYLYIFQLIYYASFRFLEFNKYEDIKKCIEEVNNKFPDWKNNKYFRMKPILFRLFCYLIANKMYFIVKILIKLRGA